MRRCWFNLIFFMVLALAGNAAKLPADFMDIEGKTHRLLDSGKLGTVFIFIMQDCPISNSYAPGINRLSSAFTNFSFFLVHVDAGQSIESARQHAADFALRPPVLLDPEHRLVKATRATITPEAVVFSSQGKRLYLGRIDDSYVAPMKKRMNTTKHDLREALSSIVVGKPVPDSKTKAVGCYIPRK